MMSKQNVELVRNGYEALIRGDLDSVAALFAPDLFWQAGTRAPATVTTDGKR
jgi:ketosteroid isomerase-like protein